MHAFRCKNCGHYESVGAAGERSTPCACSVCGAGVSFDPRSGLRKFEPENWEILARATPYRLNELGLEEVAKHTGVDDVEPRHVMQAVIVDTLKN